MRKQTLIFGILFFILIISVYGIKPQSSLGAETPSLQVEFIQHDHFDKETDIRLGFHVFNSTAHTLYNTSVICVVHLTNSTGHEIQNGVMHSEDEIFFQDIDSSNMTDHAITYLVHCNDTISKQAGFVSNSFVILEYEPFLSLINSSPLVVFPLIPLILGLFFLIGAVTLSDDHVPLKIALFLLSIPTFFVSMNIASVILSKYYGFSSLGDLLGETTQWVGIMFGVLVIYFLIYLFYTVINIAAEKKEARLKY